MAQQTTPAFKAECSDCELTHESDEFEDVSDFVEKHEEHTSHDVEWVQTDFEIEAETFVEWHLQCDTCDEGWYFGTEEKAQDFRDEHAEYTDHEIANEPSEETIDIEMDGFFENDKNLKSLISEMEGHHESGVPEQAIYVRLSDDPNLVASAKHGIEKLRRKGEVYEPTQGHLRTT